MKANKGQIEKALDAPTDAVRLYLLYGQDESGSVALAKRLERAMGPNAERIDLDMSTLKSDPARLSDEAAAMSMFGDKRWIRLLSITDDAIPALEALLEAPHAGNPVVAIGGALKATSKLVKLATDNPMAMAFVSYLPDARDAPQIAMAIARDKGLRLPNDLARRICDLTGNDRTLMGNEIEKLCLYLDAAPDRPTEATAEALNALAAETPDDDMGPLVNAVMGGDLKTVSVELASLAASGADPARATRPLLGRAMLIADVRAAFDRTGQIDAAMDMAGKAVFWKEKDVVKRQVRQWDQPSIARAIRRLSAAERASRSSRNAGTVLVEHELLAIARQAARGR